MIQLLINHYKEPENIVKRLLKSIENQESINFNDFKVIIYNDGNENILSDTFLKSFKFSIEYKILSHRGICATRNALLDNSTSEYIMFLDSDDCFHSSLGLYKLNKAINDLHYDIIGSPYEQEIIKDNKIQYLTLQKDTIRLHGKIFRRDYLIKNNIRFPDEMQTSGDMYFLWQAYNLGGNIAWLKESFYIWKYNPDSITRKDKYYLVHTFPLLLKNYDLLIENLNSRKRYDLRDSLITACIQMAYVKNTNENYFYGPKEYIDSAEKAIFNFLNKYNNQYSSFSKEHKLKIFNELTLKTHKTGKNFKGFEGLEEWANNILEKYKDQFI